jgi:hypothetical protein
LRAAGEAAVVVVDTVAVVVSVVAEVVVRI